MLSVAVKGNIWFLTVEENKYCDNKLASYSFNRIKINRCTALLMDL